MFLAGVFTRGDIERQEAGVGVGHRTYPEGKQLGAPVPFSASTQNEERSALHLFLSPLTQGTLTVTFTEWVRVRLIPADAGNISSLGP